MSIWLIVNEPSFKHTSMRFWAFLGSNLPGILVLDFDGMLFPRNAQSWNEIFEERRALGMLLKVDDVANP